MKTPYLTAGLLALAIVVVLMVGGQAYARSVEARYIYALAPQAFSQKTQGIVLQDEALRHPDLLPAYGASELANVRDGYHASVLFQTLPTGFTIYPVANGGVTSLNLLTRLAALGPELRGKRVVLTLTPGPFLVGKVDPAPYAGNFSLLHAYETVFSSDLSLDTKRQAAIRLLSFPNTVGSDQILSLGLRSLADNSPGSQLLYLGILPLGKARILLLQLQDHWEVMTYLSSQAGLSPGVQRAASAIDWAALLGQADQAAQAAANNNPFGFDNDAWTQTYSDLAATQRNTVTDDQFVQEVRSSDEWTDFALTLGALHELDAKVLVVCLPVKGVWWDHKGVSAQARGVFYDELRSVASGYGATVVDFEDHDEDKYFSIDEWSHPSAKAWAYIDQVLNAYYHGEIP